MESLLALTIFRCEENTWGDAHQRTSSLANFCLSLLSVGHCREEFGSFFVTMFAALVFVKALHWLVQDRVDYVEVTPSVSRLQHLRLVSFMSALLVCAHCMDMMI